MSKLLQHQDTRYLLSHTGKQLLLSKEIRTVQDIFVNFMLPLRVKPSGFDLLVRTVSPEGLDYTANQ